jgi:hypothetical protein
MGAMVYQNVKDPKAHGLSLTDMSRVMWEALNAKSNWSSEVLKGLAFTKLCTLKCKDRQHIRAHLDQLLKLRTEVVRIGGTIEDKEMNSIVLQSLPQVEFRGSILMLQNFKHTFELVNELMSYWEISYGVEVEDEQAEVANPLAATANTLVCANWSVPGHTKERCWALGGGQEGQACGHGIAPAGKEPHQHLVEAARAAQAARWSTKNGMAPTATAVQAAVNPSAPAETISAPTATYTSPIASTNEDLEKGASQIHSLGTDNNDLLRSGRGGPSAPILNEIVSCTISDVVNHSPAIHVTDTLHVASKFNCWCYMFLDSGASENCFVS